MEENYVLAKKMVGKFLKPDNEVYPFFVLCVYALLCKYNNHKKVVKNIFSKTLVMIDEAPIDVIMRNNGIDPDKYLLELYEGYDVDSCGISSSENHFVLCNDSEFVNERGYPFIVCSTLNLDEAEILMTVIHEYGHLIKGEVNSFYSTKGEDYVGCVTRSGISFYDYRYYPDDDTYSEVTTYNILDEAINCIQTTEAARYLLNLGEIITDLNVLNYLETLNEEILSKDFGYQAATEVFENLWKNTVFRNLVENNIVNGNISKIITEFDGVIGHGMFDKLDNLINIIEELDIKDLNESKEMKQARLSFLEIVDLYNTKTKGLVKTK